LSVFVTLVNKPKGYSYTLTKNEEKTFDILFWYNLKQLEEFNQVQIPIMKHK